MPLFHAPSHFTLLAFLLHCYATILPRALLSCVQRPRILTQTRMLASPLYPHSFSPQHSPDDATQYRPSKDRESFNKLLPAPIEFVEGSSSGTFLLADGAYEPINGSPKHSRNEVGYPSYRSFLLISADEGVSQNGSNSFPTR